MSVACNGVDEYGNRVALEDVEYVVAPQDPGTDIGGSGDIPELEQVGHTRSAAGRLGSVSHFKKSGYGRARCMMFKSVCSRVRVAYRVDELVEVQWTAEDEYGNSIDDGIGFELSLPQSGQAPSVLAVFALDFGSLRHWCDLKRRFD